MIIIISMDKQCYKILRKVLNVRGYHAQDVALCTDTPLSNPLPLACYASCETCLVYCQSVREMHCLIGALYPALPTLKTFVYALPGSAGAGGPRAAHCVQNSGGECLYLDMLHAWYAQETCVRDDGAYEFAALVQRFWSSHHAQVMLVPTEAGTKPSAADSRDEEVKQACARLQSMPENPTGNTSVALVTRVHAHVPCSFTQRRQLQSLMHAREMRCGEMPQAVYEAVDEAIERAKGLETAEERRKNFRALVTRLKEEG